ncbi:predicted protein [Naegleria gruberi]|uniref:Predicted protein n=1 Tax=Naegleria gruberi TaxID=5762 RepID=D2VWA0_NAEGR|nr:uncharacterized protein NAEGRDRAFT_73307 [Naegleria gruberi]EFC38794.1 predicted protein [Naegleria gruberi]|eukprot:XP_002671538.1 predicted protein [Naegleria gruberi strain NEG-M]
MIRKNWLKEEEDLLVKLVKEKGHNWTEIAPNFDVTPNACHKKYKDLLKNLGRKRSFWTDEMKANLLKLAKEYADKGIEKWKIIEEKLGKEAKACQQHFYYLVKQHGLDSNDFNSVRPFWTMEEKRELTELVNLHGRKWKKIEKLISCNRDAHSCQSQFMLLESRQNDPIEKKLNDIFQATTSETDLNEISLYEFFNIPTSRYNGVPASTLLVDQADEVDEETFHRSYMAGDTEFSVREVATGRLVRKTIEEIYLSSGTYETYSIESGFNVEEIANEVLELSATCFKAKLYFNECARIVEEKRFIFSEQVQVRPDECSSVRLPVSDLQDNMFIINNYQLKSKEKLVRTSLPCGQLTDTTQTKEYFDILFRTFPTLVDSKDKQGVMVQLLGAYLADGDGGYFKLYFNAKNEQELTYYFTDFLKEICELNSETIREDLKFKKEEEYVTIKLNDKNADKDIERVLQNGYQISGSILVAPACTGLHRFLKEIELLCNKYNGSYQTRKNFSSIFNITNFGMFSLYKFFEGSVQGDGTLESNRVTFGQNCSISDTHQQYFNQVHHCATMLGLKTGVGKVCEETTGLKMTGKNMTIFESEGLEKKKVNADVVFRPFNLTVQRLIGESMKKMYCFKKSNHSFPMFNGMIVQNVDTDLVSAKICYGNRWEIREMDNYESAATFCLKKYIASLGFPSDRMTRNAVRRLILKIEGIVSVKRKQKSNKESNKKVKTQ